MINLTKAILHILDGNAGVTVFSAAQLDLADDAAYGYVSKHLEKAAGDPGLHSGEFIGVENEFKIKLSQYAREMLAFEPFSAWIAGQAWEILSNSNRIDSSDLLVAEYFEGEKEMLAVLKCTGKLGYTHMVEVDEEGRQVCRIVNQYDILPGTGQKLDEAAFIEVETGAIHFAEKPRTVNGEDCPLFTKGILKCTSGVSAGETVELIRSIAETVAETYGVDKTAAVTRAKAGIAEHLDENENLAPFDLGVEVFAGNEEMEQEFRRQASAAGVPERVSVPKKLAVRTARSQKIKTDTGIEIIFPLDYAENTDFLEFVHNPDGTIAIEIKNVGSIENRG